MLKKSDTFSKGKMAPLPKIDPKSIKPVVKMKRFDKNKPVVVRNDTTQNAEILAVSKPAATKKDENDFSDLKNK